MIQEFVSAWFANRHTLAAWLLEQHPEDYEQLVREVVRCLDCKMDPARVVGVDHGDYQGTLVFVIGEKGYQPSDYWYVRVAYGSCSGCDTLQDIRDYLPGPPSLKQVDQYMTLALHIVQGLRAMQGDKA